MKLLLYIVGCSYNAVQYKHDIAHITSVTEAQYKSEFKLAKDTPYLGLTGELWGVFCEDFGENWLRYNGTALYFHSVSMVFCVIPPLL